MGRLQQTAEAQSVLSQKKKKGSKKSKKNNQDCKMILFFGGNFLSFCSGFNSGLLASHLFRSDYKAF